MKTRRILTAALMAAVMLLSCMVPVSADDDVVIYYFVDCGDYTTDTVSDGDEFGIYNTVTDQFFGADPGTGYQWGVVDEEYDEETSTSYGDSRVNTTWTWAYEYNTAGTDVPKEQSNRYCRNMYENGLPRSMVYKFEMPEDGEYIVEVGFSCPWNNSSPIDLYVNDELVGDMLMINIGETYGYGTTSPVDGYITVEATTDAATINMTYIIISNVLTNEETEVYEPYVPTPAETDADSETEANDAADDNGTNVGAAETDNTNAGDDEVKEDGGCGSELGSVIVVTAAVVGGAVTFRRKRK